MLFLFNSHSKIYDTGIQVAYILILKNYTIRLLYIRKNIYLKDIIKNSNEFSFIF